MDQTLALPTALRAESSAESSPACRTGNAQAEWAALAAGIAGRKRMRLSRDGGKTYPRRYERDISNTRPNQPAAVLIYDTAGCARTFCVDLDTSKGGQEAVERDYRSLSTILSRLGAHFFADRSPNGGIHVYVPLTEPLPYPEARTIARALAARTPTMDPMPMLGIDSGCIRPPGAWHKPHAGTAGHQQLLGTLSAAYNAVLKRTSTVVWERFTTEIGAGEQAPDRAGTPPVAEQLERLTQLRRYDAPDAAYQAIARTGEFDNTHYTSASEARQAVIWAAVASGWDFADVARRLENGAWKGLASMYARYRHNSRHGALVRDWQRAVQFEKSRRQTTPVQPVRVGPTRGPKTHGAGVYQQIRSWLNGVELVFDENRRDDLAARAVLLALAEAAQKTGSMVVEFGNRSLAIATGLDQRTVGKCLNRLVEDEDPLLDLVAPSTGVRANVYQLILPDSVGETAERRTWKKGKIRGVRAAFRELGLPAAFMYAALEQHSTPSSGRDLAVDARLGTTTAYDALATLQAFGLAHRTEAGWSIGTASLDQLSETLGIVEQIKAQIVRYREERRAYWAILGIIRLTDRTNTSVGRYDTDPPPPPEQRETCLDILENILGAHVIAETPNRLVG